MKLILITVVSGKIDSKIVCMKIKLVHNCFELYSYLNQLGLIYRQELWYEYNIKSQNEYYVHLVYH